MQFSSLMGEMFGQEKPWCVLRGRWRLQTNPTIGAGDLLGQSRRGRNTFSRFSTWCAIDPKHVWVKMTSQSDALVTSSDDALVSS